MIAVAVSALLAIATALDTKTVGCTDTTPFVLDRNPAEGWFECTKDALSCYNDIADAVFARVQGDACASAGGPCLAVNAEGFADQLRETISKPLRDQAAEKLPDAAEPGTPCPWARWPPQMDYAANIALQKASRCQVDHASILVLYQMAEYLSRQEALCVRFGFPGNSPAICDALEASTGGITDVGRSLVRLAGEKDVSHKQALDDVRTNETAVGDAVLELSEVEGSAGVSSVSGSRYAASGSQSASSLSVARSTKSEVTSDATLSDSRSAASRSAGKASLSGSRTAISGSAGDASLSGSRSAVNGSAGDASFSGSRGAASVTKGTSAAVGTTRNAGVSKNSAAGDSRAKQRSASAPTPGSSSDDDAPLPKARDDPLVRV